MNNEDIKIVKTNDNEFRYEGVLETPETPESSETPDGQHPQDTAPTTPSRQCTIATQATLIAFSQRADGTTADSASIAMRPEEALTIMSLPDSLPVIATRR